MSFLASGIRKNLFSGNCFDDGTSFATLCLKAFVHGLGFKRVLLRTDSARGPTSLPSLPPSLPLTAKLVTTIRASSPLSLPPPPSPSQDGPNTCRSNKKGRGQKIPRHGETGQQKWVNTSRPSNSRRTLRLMPPVSLAGVCLLTVAGRRTVMLSSKSLACARRTC